MPVATPDTPLNSALAASASALRRIASYSLPPALDQRLLDLGERKETLSTEEREELLAWVAFTQQRSAEKLAAEVALQRMATAAPELLAVS